MRVSVTLGFTSLANGLLQPGISEMLCSDTTIVPEAALDGAVIVVDLPVKSRGAEGRFVQSVWKYLFQQAVERRRDVGGSKRRPVFLWVDETQEFCSEHDSRFQATARSSRCAGVYLTQNISAFYAEGGTRGGVDAANGFLGNLNTKIFHANNDVATNNWASAQLGVSSQPKVSVSSNAEKQKQHGLLDWLFPKSTTGISVSSAHEPNVRPDEFTRLRTGGPANQGIVEVFFMMSGKRFQPEGRQYFKTTFQQELRR